MRKIPTVFKRDPENMRHVLPEVTPGCEWVLDGEGVGTRKYDGTCVMLDGAGQWFARREVKPGRAAPAAFIPVETDETTGKTVGWEPVEQSGFAKWHAQALANRRHEIYEPGTYELCGPKVNGNPEGYPEHILVSHAHASVITGPGQRWTFEKLALFLTGWCGESGAEGIVWHHPDGRMAKLKARDFARTEVHA